MSYGAPVFILSSAALCGPLPGAAFALPRPDALSPLPVSPAAEAHNTRRYGHTLVGGPGRSGWGYADFHDAVNFAFTQFYEVQARATEFATGSQHPSNTENNPYR